MTERNDRDSHQQPDDQAPKPSSRAKFSIILIGVGFFSSIICMCVVVFALASL